MSNSGPGIPYNVTHPPPALIGLGWMFYIVKPSDTYFEKLDQVPDFIAMATPYFLTSIVIELALFWWKYKKSSLRFNDSFSSLSAGIYQQVYREKKWVKKKIDKMGKKNQKINKQTNKNK